MGAVMEYKVVLKELRSALRFLQPLAKVIEHMEYLESLEKKEKSLDAQLDSKAKSLLETETKLGNSSAELLKKQEKVRAELQATITKETAVKDKILTGYNDKITAAEGHLETVTNQRRLALSESAKLKQEKVVLEKEVAALKNAMAKANASVAAFEGG